jgi:hypothetical protein
MYTKRSPPEGDLDAESILKERKAYNNAPEHFLSIQP